MRLIDADRLLKAFCGHCEDYENCKTTCFDFRIIQTQPTVDAVPVVRCKDCKWCKTPYCKMDVWHKDVTIFNAREFDFCSYGERKEEDT